VSVSLFLALLAAAIVFKVFAANPAQHSDFGPVWFATKTVLRGDDPYLLIGPGREFAWTWQMTYPATAILTVLPFAVVTTEVYATALFSALSTFLLAWGATRDGWFRMPAFASYPFLIAAAAGQWSMLIAASLFLPLAAVFWSAKPTISAAIAAGQRDRKTLIAGFLASAALVAVSLWIIPGWPREWIGIVSRSQYFTSPIMYPGGFMGASVLLRWRRPEAWLLFLALCVPQSPGVYDLLIIMFAIPRTYRESCVLSASVTLGGLMIGLVPAGHVAEWVATRGMLQIATCYLPAVVMVLRRLNVSSEAVPNRVRST